MKIAVSGHEGNIGRRLVNMGCAPLPFDVRNPDEIRDILHRVKPDVILHLAAHTSVDFCEENYEEAIAVNVFGTSAVCQIAEEVLGEGKVVLVSSCQVFDGESWYRKEEDEPSPVNNYGLTKLAAEGVVQLYGGKVVRISRCFDSKSQDIVNYLSAIARKEYVRVPSHILRSYTHFDFIAEAFYEYANRFQEMPETLHLAGLESVSFFNLMYLISQEYGFGSEFVTSRGELPGHVARPHKGGLDVSLAKSLGFSLYSVEESVKRMRNE